MTSNEQTFAFVDLAGFTAYTEAHGDRQAVAALNRFRSLVDVALEPGDLFVKSIGDAVMLAFANPARAATALQRLFDTARSDPTLPLVRGGTHTGPAVEDSGDFYGAVVNLAARIGARARAGQLLATAPVALAASDAGAVVSHIGAVPLRSIAEPVDLYDIEVGDGSGTAVDPVCAMKVPTTGAAAIHLRHPHGDAWFCGLPCVARYAATTGHFYRSSLVSA